MIPTLSRLIVSTAGLIAIVAGFQVFPATPSPGRASLDSLDVSAGLRATLMAEAPMLTNPTNLDVDARGRVWVLEGFNYRKFKPKTLREGGDRIVILEDTTGDGIADKSTVFYQGRDIDAAMGIAVLGNKVYVSAYKNIFVFTDTDGDDKPDRKEVLFTSIGEDHDHSVHAFVFGPDGRIYFNGGNETGALMDRAGTVLVDRAGNRIEQKRAPYQEGMAFRLEPDGTGVDVIGHNFRNPYELAVDAYGTVWQSDNDDDGNRATRLNYVMEGGNFGFRDEMTGAGWRTKRTGMSAEIPRQHWHADDPGSVPSVRINGAGSPSGMAIYSGTLLPRAFRGAIMHADAGTAEVRAYPVRADGAGYTSDVIPIVRAPRDRMFRPVDVATAPDGSIVIADWYDAGVGGHNMSDQTQGRIIRIAPPGTRYAVPTLDLSTAAGAARALRSPNHATQYLAYERLHGMGVGAERALLTMYGGAHQAERARALWLLARIPERGARHLQAAALDANPDIRVVALRATRRIGADVMPIAERLVRDPSPAVRREVALSLRHAASPRAAALWAILAQQYDGRDRWYLEALGIAADRQWDSYFGEWLAQAKNPTGTAAARDVVWRSRSSHALPLLEQLASNGAAHSNERLRYFRALDFHLPEPRQRALLAILRTPSGGSAELTPVILAQLDAPSAKALPLVQAALQRTLAGTRGTTQFVELVEKYDARDQLDELIRTALLKPNETAGAESARLALAWGGAARFAAVVLGQDDNARRALSVLGRNYTPAVDTIVVGVVTDTSRALGLRRWAVQSMGNGSAGTQRLLRLVQMGRLPDDLKPAAAGVLFSSNAAVRDSAAKHLSAPASTTLDGRTLPPILALAARSGDAGAGRAVYQRACAACHVAQGAGLDFGPGLTEIGDKLPKAGLYMAILDPSAGVAFGYEGYEVRTREGQQITGYIASETADEIVVKLGGGMERRVPKSTITGRTRMDNSLMPHGLERGMTEAELVHLVEYLSALRRPR